MIAPIVVYSEKMWEIHDEQNARVIAHVFDEDYAHLFAEAINASRRAGSAGLEPTVTD